MGGNALQTVKTKRMDIPLYKVISREILDILEKHYVKVKIPFEKPGKVDHGDVDVLCLINEEKGTFDPIKQIGSKECVRNGHVVSFEYKNCQIDMIHVTTLNQFDFSTVFYSYGDTGMILGMLCKTLGLLLGDKKLKILLPKPIDAQKLFLTDDIYTVLKFMGLSIEEWNNGFNSLEEVFLWITSSRLFRPNMFKRETFDTRDRKRDNDRPMFTAFVDFCMNHKFSKEVFEREKISKDNVFDEVLLYFDKKREYHLLLEEYVVKEKVKKNFNGKLVMEWVDLSGKDLGLFINEFKKKYPDSEIITMSLEDVERKVKELFSSLRNPKPMST